MEERSQQRNCASCASAAAQTLCLCTSPPTYLCGTCGLEHAVAPHKLMPLPESEEEKEWTRCSLCNLSKSALLCCCVLPPVPLCRTCMQSHDRQSDFPHVHVSIRAQSYLTSSENVEKLILKHISKEEARVKLFANLEKIASAEKEVHLECEKLISALRKQEVDLCSRLHKIKEELSLVILEAVREAEEHLHEEDYQCTGLTAAILSYGKLVTKPELSIFSYVIDSAAVETALSQFMVLDYDELVQNCGNPENFIPVLTSKSLRKYDYEHDTWLSPVTLSKVIEVSTQSSWIFIDGGKWIFTCGRHPSSASAYLIDSSDGTVEQQPPMRTRRCEHGMVAFQNNVYVFGGLDSPKYLKSCEKFNRILKVWTPLPDMHEARDCFNPCILKGAAYLIGGRNAKSAELFDIASETFKKLRVSLPRSDMTSCIVFQNSIVAMQSDCAYEWEVEVENAPLRMTRLSWGESWSNTPPVFSNGFIYILSFAKSIKKTNLRSCSSVPIPTH